MDSTTLDLAIVEAQRRGDWYEVDRLNSAKLAEVRSRTDHNGQVRPAAPAPAEPAATAPAEPSAPGLGSFDGGVQPHTPTPTVDEQIAAAQASGDWAALDRLNAAKLAGAAARQRARDLSPSGV